MANKQRYTADEVSKALRENNGLLFVAAAKLGCSLKTVERYIDRYPAVAEARREAKFKRDDFVESRMFKRIEEGSDTMMIFYAKTQMKQRGYVERVEVDDVSNWRRQVVAGLLDKSITIESIRANFDPATALDLFQEAGIKLTEDVIEL